MLKNQSTQLPRHKGYQIEFRLHIFQRCQQQSRDKFSVSPSLSRFALKKKNLYKAWIQRRPGMDTETEGVDTETGKRGYSDVLFLGLHFKKETYTERGYSDDQAWIQRRLGGYSDGLDI